jgi:protein-tyrosine phosphatase
MANLRFAEDVFGMPEATVTKEHFDTVVTLYAWAKPADWFVKELRLGILDGDLSDFDWEEMRNLVLTAHGDWKAGKRVLIRCQAGITRSSLVMALVLIREGFSAKKAIELMRQKRGQAVLANRHFVEWLTDLDVRKWRE